MKRPSYRPRLRRDILGSLGVAGLFVTAIVLEFVLLLMITRIV